jgi:CRP-like cAMP-binding protein
MGGGKALSSAVVQRPGLAWRMSARDIADLARDFEPVMQQLLRYTQALFTHMAQNSACHRHHALAPQLCRWLLQHLDRQAGDEMRITHERIAGMLGVRREGVTGAALQLQRHGLHPLQPRAHQVLDRRGLEKRSCECYGVVEQAYEQLRSVDGDAARLRSGR